VDPAGLSARRFCNLIHHWLASNVDERQRQELDRLLTGPLTSNGSHAAVDAEAGVRPPAWWDGDEDAAASSMAAVTYR
jgi:hypothetical protein